MCLPTLWETHRNRSTDMTDDEFLDAFEAQAISRADWTHEAHVRMGWLYCTRHETFGDAVQCACTGIRALNKANGVADNLYHQTVTIAFMRLIHARIEDAGLTWPGFRDAHPELLSREKPILLAYYSKALLETDEARLDFVEPDLQKIP